MARLSASNRYASVIAARLRVMARFHRTREARVTGLAPLTSERRRRR
jgi:hypothetical protein